MLTGAHSIIYSTNADADRAFLRDVLKLTHVDVGHGWLIFGLPPAEVAVHPGHERRARAVFHGRRGRRICRGDEDAWHRLRSRAESALGARHAVDASRRREGRG